jgi:short chain dehydrogenase
MATPAGLDHGADLVPLKLFGDCCDRPGRDRLHDEILRTPTREVRRRKYMARIFITGSAGGLGRAAAQSLLGEAHEVIVHVRSAERLAAVNDLIGRGASAVVGDLADLDQTRAVAEQVSSGGYWFHQRLRAPHPAVRDPHFQDDLLDAVARFTGVPLT